MCFTSLFRKGRGGAAVSVLATGRNNASNLKKRPKHCSEMDCTTKKNPGHSAEGKQSKTESGQRRKQTYFYNGVVFPLWRGLKADITLRLGVGWFVITCIGNDAVSDMQC